MPHLNFGPTAPLAGHRAPNTSVLQATVNSRFFAALMPTDGISRCLVCWRMHYGEVGMEELDPRLLEVGSSDSIFPGSARAWP
jgi:hypothetical protein